MGAPLPWALSPSLDTWGGSRGYDQRPGLSPGSHRPNLELQFLHLPSEGADVEELGRQDFMSTHHVPATCQLVTPQLFHFMREQMEAQRGQATCAGPHSREAKT